MDPRVSLALRRRSSKPIAPDELARELGLSPKRLVQEIEELARAGFAIESHPILGLRLAAAPGLLADEIVWQLPVSRIGRHVRCVNQTSSTNDLAWQEAARGQDAADGLAVFAEHQTAGRGRRGNAWIAPAGSSILVSVVCWITGDPNQGALLTRATAVAAAEAIEEQASLKVGIRWPNDLVLDDRKVGGILVEARPSTGAMGPVVIGLGLNVSQDLAAFPPEIRRIVTSLAMLVEDVDRTLLARSLLVRLDRVLGLAFDQRGAEAVRQSAAERCRTLGRRITIQESGSTFRGEVIGLDPDYALVLRLSEGGIRSFPAMTAHVMA